MNDCLRPVLSKSPGDRSLVGNVSFHDRTEARQPAMPRGEVIKHYGRMASLDKKPARMTPNISGAACY